MDINTLVDKALNKSVKTAPRKMLEEPKHVLVHRMFKTWKLFKYETSSQDAAYDKFNTVMEQLSQCNSAIVDVKRSKVIMKDISPSTCLYTKLKYVVEVYWRNIH